MGFCGGLRQVVAVLLSLYGVDQAVIEDYLVGVLGGVVELELVAAALAEIAGVVLTGAQFEAAQLVEGEGLLSGGGLGVVLVLGVDATGR